MPASRLAPARPRALARRRLVNTLNLTTPLGRAIARVGGATLRPGPEGLEFAEGYRLPFPVAAAFTVGNVVLTASDFDTLEQRWPGMVGHEGRHAWQYAHLGLAFLPLYGVAALWSLARFGNPAVGNVFEEGAGLVSGNYLASGAARPAPRGTRDLVRVWRAWAGGGRSGHPGDGPAAGGAA